MATPDLKVLIIGAGSIGGRHARHLTSAGAHVEVTDPNAERAAQLGVTAVPFDLGSLAGYDGIVVASPTVFHLEQAGAALETTARVLVEKPLSVDDQGLDNLVERAGTRVMVGYNLRLHRPVRQLVELAHAGRAGRISSVRVWFGSWLPDWRPGVDYRTTYSAQAQLGGGVLLDAIHELDLLVWLAGDDRYDVLAAVVDRVGPLEIDVEDTVKALLRHDNGIVAEASLDYLSRRYRRGIEVIGEAATLRLDWARNVVEVEDEEGVQTEAIECPIDISYRLEAERFLSFVRGESDAPVDAVAGAASVRLAQRIREAAR